jgi:hypothetical protein
VLQDSLREIKKLAEFMKVDASDEMLKTIDSLCQFDKMKKEKNVNEDPSEWRDNNPGMYRKGERLGKVRGWEGQRLGRVRG